MIQPNANRPVSPRFAWALSSLASFILGFALCWVIKSSPPPVGAPSSESPPPATAGKSARLAARSPAVAAQLPTPATPPPPPQPRSVTPDVLERQWGLQVAGVGRLTNGSDLWFAYKVTNPDKVNLLNNDSIAAFLIHPKTGGKMLLRIPAPPGAASVRTRARSAAVASQQYWSFPPPRHKLFEGMDYYVPVSNRELPLKSGETVSLVLGNLRLDQITVR